MIWPPPKGVLGEPVPLARGDDLLVRLRARVLRRGDAGIAAQWVFVTLLALVILYPLAELVYQPLSTLTDTWEDLQDLPQVGAVIWNTILLAGGSMLLATAVALLLAWCRGNLAGPLGHIAQISTLLPLMVPPLAGVTGWAFLLSPKVGYLNQLLRLIPPLTDWQTGPADVYSLTWIVIITGIYLVPYAFIFIQAGLANVDTRLEDAARIFGSSWYSTQIRVVLPLLRPSLIYGAGVVSLLALGQFTAPLMLGRTKGIDVITTVLYRLTGTPPPDYALATMLALPLLVLSLCGVAAQRFALRDSQRFIMAPKGAARARGHRPLLVLPVIGYAVLVTIPPLIGLITVAASPFWNGTIDPRQLSLAAFREIFTDPVAMTAIGNSLEYAATATVLTLCVSLLAALVILRGSGAVRLITDYVVNVPIAVPAILFGMGIFVAYGLGPVTRFLNRAMHINLYGSAALIVLAYTVLTLPHATRLIMSGLAQLNPQLESAARVFGSRPFGVVFRVLVPLPRRNLMSAAMLALILSSHEFAASVLLVGPDTQVMATALYNQWDTGTYPHVAALALIMVAIAIVCVSIVALTDLSGRHRSAPGGA